MAVNFKLAHLLAEELTTIPDCPRSEGAMEAIAKDLCRLCKSDEEAQELVCNARDQWASWKGTPGLIEVLQDMRMPASMPLERRTIDLGPKPAVNCAACQDWGYVFRNGQNEYCSCAAGSQAKADGFLETMRTRKFKGMRSLQVEPPPRPISEADLEAAFKQRQSDNEAMIARMKAVLADPTSSKEEKEMAREYLKGMDTGQAS